MSDGTNTEIISGIANGVDVITEINETADETPAEPQQEQSPFAPGPRKNDKKK